MSTKEFSADSGAAIEDTELDDGEFVMLDDDMVVESLTNPRQTFNLPRLKELAESVKVHGVQQPIVVRVLPASRLHETFEGRRKGAPLPSHEVIMGARRKRANTMAGRAKIPAIVKKMTDAQVLEVQLIENLQRDDLHPMEEAEGYERLCKETSVTKEQLADKVGKSRSYVYARLKLLELTSDARAAFYEDKIDASRALVIARIPDAALQHKALQEATRKDFNDAVPSFRAFVRWAQQNVMLRLDAARFKITDASLVPEAGSCKDCTKRTGAAPDLFADVDSADVCVDPKCFHAKAAAHEEAVLAVAKARGQKIIGEREAKKLWSWEHGKIDGYVRLDRPDERVGGSKMLKTILGKDAPEPILMQNPHKGGELIEVAPAEKVTKLLKESGRITPQQSRSDRVISADEAKRNAAAKYEKTWRKRAIAVVHQVMADSVHGSEIGEKVARLIASELLSGLRGDERQHVCELLGLGKVADQAAIEDYLANADVLRAEQAMYLLLMQQDMLQLVSWSNGTPIEAKRIAAVAEDYAVDLAPIKKAVKDELEEAARPKVKAQKSEDSAPASAKAQGAKKSTAPPAAQKPRARKPSAEEVQAQIADAFQAIDQAPDGAGQESAADAAREPVQAPGGAAEEEGAAPAARSLTPLQAWPFPKEARSKVVQEPIALGKRVRVRPTMSHGANSAYLDKEGKVSGEVMGAGTPRWQVNFTGISRVGRWPKIAEFDAEVLEVVEVPAS